MWYVIFSQDVENSLEKRLSARPAHLERLQTLQNEGRLLTAGQCQLLIRTILAKRVLQDLPLLLSLILLNKLKTGLMRIRISKQVSTRK